MLDIHRTHLLELRNRLMVSLLAVLLCSATAYAFSEPITRFFMAPLFAAQPGLGKLVYTNLTEAFFAYFKVAFLVGLAAAFPVLLYQVWMFVAPGLLRREKVLALKVLSVSTLLFAGGVSFAYFVVLPRLLGYMLSLAGPGMKALPKLGGYLTFVARTALGFGLAFEIPFLMLAATGAGLVGPGYFRTRRKFFYPAIVVLAFLLAAGDPAGGVLLALPLFALYEAGNLVIGLFASPASAGSN